VHLLQVLQLPLYTVLFPMGAAASSSPPPTVLCIAGDQSAAVIASTGADIGFVVERVATTALALSVLASSTTQYVALIAALGMSSAPETFLFDEGKGDRSTLIQRARDAGCVVIVYSHTASSNPAIGDACHDAGAHGVVNDAAGLLREMSIATLQRAATAAMPAAVVAAPPAEAYPPLARRSARDAELAALCGADSEAVRYNRSITLQLLESVEALPRPLLLPMAMAAPPLPPAGAVVGSPPHPVRIVVVSDTHHHHDRLILPPGNVLLHCGDIVGNYGDTYDLLQHLRDFLDWITRDVAPHYGTVLFIAGNHDTILDRNHRRNRDPDSARGRDHRAALEMLQSRRLPSNVRYLEHEAATVTLPLPFLGTQLRVWGSPATSSREETMGKRYYSNAFETYEAERVPLWDSIPEGLDILMTHTPPDGPLSSHGDVLLAQRLAAMTHPPTLHCFGHDHDHIGVVASPHGNGGISLNAAQEQLLRLDKRGGGCAWMVDVVPRGGAPPSLPPRAMGSME